MVALAFPPKFTTDPFTNPEPFTVSVNAPEPAVAFAGESVVITGAGLVVSAPSWLMVNVWQPAVMVRVRGAPLFSLTE